MTKDSLPYAGGLSQMAVTETARVAAVPWERLISLLTGLDGRTGNLPVWFLVLVDAALLGIQTARHRKEY